MQTQGGSDEQKNRSIWVGDEAILQRNCKEGALQQMEEILQQKNGPIWEHILQPNGEEKTQLQQQRLIQEEDEERRRVRARPVEMEERLKIAARTLRPTGGKDRHSKVNTARGPRDRRVRLSVPTAVMFYEVQDRLGFDQPSKAVEWLMTKAKSAIDELADLPFPVTTICSSSSCAVAAVAAISSSSSPCPRSFRPQHEDSSVKPHWQIHPHNVEQPRMEMNSLLPHIPIASTSSNNVNPLTLPPSHFSFPSPDHHSSFNPLSRPNCSTSLPQSCLFSSHSTPVSHSRLRLTPQHFVDPCLDFAFQPQFSSHSPARIQGLYEDSSKYSPHKGSS